MTINERLVKAKSLQPGDKLTWIKRPVEAVCSFGVYPDELLSPRFGHSARFRGFVRAGYSDDDCLFIGDERVQQDVNGFPVIVVTGETNDEGNVSSSHCDFG